ncbi:PAS domain S-box protein [Candidatus Albibeggiatoa sp. nov. BB20]|uniref:PAS domain S-box protein n=1 Tax=Candidatus Albibeggiatoa sp. nov. BB20 TaxID=3162723 RepID=UPI00336530BC
MSANNAQHSRFFWRSSALFCILDFKRQFIEVNTAWETLLGLTTGQLLAKPFLSFVHPEDQPSTQYYFEQMESGLTTVSFSCRFRCSDETYRTILWETNNAASSEYAYYAVGMDISDREQPMVADEMLNVLREGVVLQYANGTIGACNPSAERILGLSAEQMMGWTLIDPDWGAIHEDGSPFPTETHPAICTLRTGEPYSDVMMGVVKPDGSIVWIRINSYPLWRDDVTTPYAVVISFADMSAYKEMEQALRKNTQKPSISNLPEGNYDLWDWELENNTVNFSPRWRQMFGFNLNEAINTINFWHDRIHPDDYQRVMTDIQNTIEGITSYCENSHRIKDNQDEYRWVLNHAVVVRDTDGKAIRMIGTHVDITESHSMEDELQKLERKYRQVLEVEDDGLFLVEQKSLTILDVNKAASHIYGYSRGQLLEKTIVELSAQPDKAANALQKNTKEVLQQYHTKQDGNVFPVEMRTSPFKCDNKQWVAVAVRDVSEKRDIETSLWENESKYRQLFEAASNPTVVYDANTQYFFDVNRAAVDLYGYSKEEFSRMTTEAVSAESQKRAAFSTNNKKVQVIPLRWHRKKDGTVFPVEISAGNTYLFQGRSLICATVKDITERKAAEEALRKEKDFINTLVQASPAFFFAINPDGKTRMINKAMLTALGYELSDVTDKEFLTTFIPESERAIASKEFDTLIKTMQPLLMESHVLTKSGHQLLVEWHSRAIVKANGSLDYLFGVGIDVTERKKAQGHLRLFKSIIESSEEAIFISNPNGELIYINPAHERLFRRNLKEAKQLSFRDYFPAESLNVLESQISPEIEKGGTWEGELDMMDNQGTTFPVWQRVDAVRDAKGTVLFSFGLLHDISERKRMWETLRKQWEEQQMIFNTVPAMIWYRDNDNHLLKTNKLAKETFGNDESITSKFNDCEETIQLGKPQYDISARYSDEHNDTHWLQIDKIPYRNNQGEIVGVIVFALDVTEYKQTQASLQASEERMYMVVEHMPIMLNAFDIEGNIIFWNQACEDITGYSADDMVANPKALDILYPDINDRRRMLDERRRVADDSKSLESHWKTQLACKEGNLKNVTWVSVAKHFPIPGWHTWHLGQIETHIDPNAHKHHHLPKTIADSEALISSIFDIVKLGVCITDDRGRYLQVNRTYVEMYGYTEAEMVGEPFTLVLPTATHSDAVREYYSILMTREDPSFVKRRGEQRKNGDTIDVQIMASRVILEDRRRVLVSIVAKV